MDHHRPADHLEHHFVLAGLVSAENGFKLNGSHAQRSPNHLRERRFCWPGKALAMIGVTLSCMRAIRFDMGRPNKAHALLDSNPMMECQM
jgi:hypothetical protein